MRKSDGKRGCGAEKGSKSLDPGGVCLLVAGVFLKVLTIQTFLSFTYAK